MKRVEILREKIKRLVPLLTGMSIRVTQAGASAYVERDPETLRPNRVNLIVFGIFTGKFLFTAFISAMILTASRCMKIT